MIRRHLAAAVISVSGGLLSLWIFGTSPWSLAFAAASTVAAYPWTVREIRKLQEARDA